MLIIRRRRGESIVIGDGIEIEILETAPGHVKIGIVAPKQVPVVRKEIQIAAEANRAAAEPVSSDALDNFVRTLNFPQRNPQAHR